MFSVPWSHLGFHLALSPQVSSATHGCDSFSDSPCCDNWDSSEEDHLLFFLMIRQGSWVLGRKTTEVKCPSHDIISAYILTSWLIAVMLTLSAWTRSCLSVFSTVKFLSISPPHCPLWKRVTMCSPHLRSGGLGYPPYGQRVYINYMEFFYMGGLSLLPTYLFITYLYQHGLVDLSYTLVYSPVLPYLFCCSTCSSFGYFQVLLLASVSLWNDPISACVCVHVCTWVCVYVCVCLKRVSLSGTTRYCGPLL